jgi:hypothetical protein
MIAVTSILLLALIALLFSSFLIWLGAGMIGVKDGGFGKAFIAALGGVFVSWFMYYLMAAFPAIGSFIGFIIGLVLTLFIIKSAFNITFGKALLIWIFYIIAEAATVAVGILILGLELLAVK